MVFFNKQVVPGMELSGAETGRGEQKAAHWELSRSQAPAGNAIFYIKLYSEKFALCMGAGALACPLWTAGGSCP
jgi:hypothetical protein